MPVFKIAHIKQNGVNVIILPLAPHFGTLTLEEKDSVVTAFQKSAAEALLNGTVVPVWDNAGKMHFIAPSLWHGFFGTLSLKTVRANLNRELDTDSLDRADDGSETTAADAALRDLLPLVDPHEKWPVKPPQLTGVPALIERFKQLLGISR